MKHDVKKTLMRLFIITGFLILAIGCMQPFSTAVGKGAVSISIMQSKGPTIQPENLEIASYVLSGTGPNNESLSNTTFTTEPYKVDDLTAGSWTFTVKGKNSNGRVVATGSVSATIVQNTTTNVNIVLTPPNEGTGTGTFTITGTIGAGITLSSFTGVISPKSGGTDISFSVNFSGTTLSYTKSLTANSNYELTLRAVTTDGKEWSDIYALRIYDNETSTLTLDLKSTDFHQPALGTPTVTVDPSTVTNGVVGQSYSFTVTADNIPSGVNQVTFSYNFGDGSASGTGSQAATVSNHSASITISHTYSSSSAYGLTVAVSDGSTTLATGYASVIIGQVNSGNDYDLTVLNSWIAANSGGYGITIDTWDISQLPAGCVFDFKFDTVGQPDKYIIEYPDGTIVVDTGWRGDSFYEGRPAYPGGIAGDIDDELDAIFTKGSQQHFKITIIGGEPGTVWYYSIRARMP